MNAAEPTRRLGRAVHIAETIVCDGKPGKAIWAQADVFDGFTEPWGPSDKTGKVCPIEITARVLWSDTTLYVRFDSANAEIVAQRTRRQSDVCNDSCCEMFISPFLDAPERYFTFEINALGTMLNHKNDLSVTPVSKQNWFPLGMRIGHSLTGVSVNQPGPAAFAIELAVPWSQFMIGRTVYRPKKGDRWRVNFMRCGGKQLNPYLMWSPAGGPKPAFHQPKYFGTLEFA